MSGVLLRCPNCGTTKATPGECEACHEADVRYFCTNHTPGHWLDTPKCPDCGARFGEKAAPVQSRPPPPISATPAKPSLREPKRPARSSAEPGPTGPWDDAKLRRRPEGHTLPSLEEEPEEVRRKAELRDAVPGHFPELDRRLRRSASAREPVYLPDAARTGFAIGRFLLRAVLFGFFLLVMLLLGALLLGGTLLQGAGIYVF